MSAILHDVVTMFEMNVNIGDADVGVEFVSSLFVLMFQRELLYVNAQLENQIWRTKGSRERRQTAGTL